MLSRQRTILRMLASAGPIRNKLDLVKLLFLVAEEHPSLLKTARHEFLPYHRGPYSFTLAHDLTALERTGLVTQGVKDVSLTPLGLAAAEHATVESWTAVEEVRHNHGGKTTGELIDHVYATYAWYTLNSKWVDRRRVEFPRVEVDVYTTGYEDVSLDGLLNRLLKSGIERLIDVRANPVARRFGFHKSTLARLCPKVGIEYVHVPAVGVPSAWRSELDTPAAYRALFARYAANVLPTQGDTLEFLAKMVSEKPSTLMCKEADPACCHRTTLAAELSKRTGLDVRDLGQEEALGLF